MSHGICSYMYRVYLQRLGKLKERVVRTKTRTKFGVSIGQPTLRFLGTAGKCAFGSHSMVLAQQDSDTFQLTHARCTQ